MADYDNNRPSKRRRRDSRSLSPSETTRERGRRHGLSPRRGSAQDYDRSVTRPRSREKRSDTHSTREHSKYQRDSNGGHESRRIKRRSRSRENTSRDRNHASHRRRDRSISPRPGHRRNRDSDKAKERSHRDSRKRSPRESQSPQASQRSKAPLPSPNDAFTSTTNPGSARDKPVEKQKPNFGLTGKLAAASNTIQTANQMIVLKYHEPSEARKPSAKDQWRLYVFTGDEILDTVELFEQSCWLMGREVAVADLSLEHPSCSKQHAVIQFRYLEKRNEFGDKIGKVKPYILDLESANGTSLNGELVPAAKYVELRDKDVLKFGHSSREYVIQLPR